MRSRIIGLILIKDGLAVQSINFKKFLPLGRVEILMEHLLRWGIDEITLLDITKDIEFKDRFYKNLRNISRNCNVPIAVGGGIKNIKNADFIFANGGDKIIINTEFFNRPKILNDLSNKYGKQSVILSIDLKKIGNNYFIFINNGRTKMDINFKSFIKKIDYLEIGEVLINSIDRDGSKKGYDLELLKLVKKNVNIPINFTGGVGKKEHFIQPLLLKINGLCCGNYFSFSEKSVFIVKNFLSSKYKNLIRYKY